jgi:hypothetical protein
MVREEAERGDGRAEVARELGFERSFSRVYATTQPSAMSVLRDLM